MGGALELFDLLVEVVAAAEHLGEDFVGVFGEAEELLADLLGQLAGGGEHEALDVAAGVIHLHEQRQAKGGRLARAGLRLRDEVVAFLNEEGDDLLLNRCGRLDAQLLQGTNHFRRDAEFCEGM